MDQDKTDKMQLTSPAFNTGDSIPTQYTCKGENISPPLNIVDVPKDAKSLALIMHDPDAPVGDFLHWLIWDIQPSTQSIGAGSMPVGAVQGPTGFGKNEYGGPCPPAGTGTHRYIFELYALDTSLGLSPDSPRKKLEDAMKGHVLQHCMLTGTVAADNQNVA
jgi:Raf kinase inhibitor-like YbhB/YbcL family protein